MAIKVIAQRRELKIGKNPGVKKLVMRPDLYIPIQEKKVFAEASTHSGISAGVIKAAWDAAGEVIRTWARNRKKPRLDRKSGFYQRSTTWFGGQLTRKSFSVVRVKAV